MPRLQVEIGGNVSGLGQAANQAFGILENLQSAADKLKIDLFKASDVATLNATGGALTVVTGKIKEYTDAAIKGSAAFQDQKTSAILQDLNSKILILTGNAQIFGDSLKNQKSQVSAYESAISKLLSNGLSPVDAKVVSLKANIDSLNKTMSANATANLNAQYQATGKLIPDLQDKISRLKTALSGATDERSIVQYNLRLKQAQAELERLRTLGVATGNTLTTSANNAANAARRLSGGYNAVGLEFGRIIQDAPFAANNFGAIGNNITRLVEVIPQYLAQTRAIIVANGGVATSANVAKTAIAGLFTGFGGVTIAISALVAGFTIYQQHQQKVKRETEALTGANKEYIETLKGVERAQLQGIKNAQQELTDLRLLTKVYFDSTATLEARKLAYEQLHRLQPQVFLKFEETAAKSTKEAYQDLTLSIIASARARAASNLISKNAERQLENENKIIRLRIEQQKALNKELALGAKVIDRPVVGGGSLGGISAQDTKREDEFIGARSERLKLDQQIINLTTDSNKLGEENLVLESKANDLLKNKKATLDDINNVLDKTGKKYKDTLTPKVDANTDRANLAGLIGNDIEVQKAFSRYENLLDDINAEAKKKGADLTKIQAARAQAEVNLGKEISQIIIAENIRVSEEIQRINNESGVKANEDRQKELLQISKWYDEQVIKAQGNAAILTAIEEGRQIQVEAVNAKYAQKRLDAETKLVDLIQKENDKSFTLNENHTKRATQKIDEELQKRLNAVKKYFDELRKMYANDPLAQAVLNITQNKVSQGITNKADVAKDGGLGRELSRGVSKFGSDLFRVLTTFNQQADQTFSAILGNLAKTLTDSLSDVFVNIFQKKLTEILDSAFSSMSASQQALAGAALLAGNVISGLFPKTSSAGQGLGGALKGAGTGALLGSAIPVIGTAVGAAVGGLVGLLGGIFGASKARKEEELQKKQLAEQEKQTKLMERQNALAYTASIIGRMTTSGIVTGIEVNEFGQLSTKIAGQDLAIILERANRSRKRGT